MALFLFAFGGCDQSTSLEDEERTSEDLMSLEDMEEGMFSPGNADLRIRKGIRPETGEPIMLEVIDDNANPLFARGLLNPDEMSSGWISLFDGSSLFGWQSNNPEVNWKVENGAITADEGPVGLLLTKVPFANFELYCEFRIEAGGNSGLFLRSTWDPKDLKRDCVELNIAGEHPEGYTTGSLVERAKTKVTVAPSTDWQTLRVSATRKQFVVELNGQEVLSYQETADSPRTAGLIGLQQRIGKVEFRKLNLKPYFAKSLFNGTDLSGWKIVPGANGTFTVEENNLRVRGGLGFIETAEQFKNFIFQTDVRTRTPEINSGFFFRAETGTEAAPSNGYEVQIHNGFIEDDRNQPNNSGSGAIFRRAEARRVVANDLEWFTMTLVADGPRYAVWVDGFQVVDWTDDRPPHENPRKGLRLKEGHISLQAHDPTTDCEFRNMRIAELPDDPESVTPPNSDSDDQGNAPAKTDSPEKTSAKPESPAQPEAAGKPAS